MSEWQDIETAPKDGTEVDLFFPKFGRMTDFKWRSVGLKAWVRVEGYPSVTKVMLEQPSHWMPLPPPPTHNPEKEE